MSVGPFHVSKDSNLLDKKEKGPLGCTICEEDQKKITLKNQISFLICHKIADKVQKAMNQILSQGLEIKTVIAYRPSISKGELNSKGERTLFSNHAYGVAFDINENFNGLYENCLHWNSACILRKAGRYEPSNPLSIKEGDPFTRILKANGFMWGGAIAGQQKDFMHFSPDGH